jgi:hypothetical protein
VLFDGRLPDRISNTATALSWCARGWQGLKGWAACF